MKLFRTILSGLFLLSSVTVFAAGCFMFGTKLERAAFFYARGQSQETLHALFESTKWAAIVENKNRQIDLVCRKLAKKQRKGLCPAEGV